MRWKRSSVRRSPGISRTGMFSSPNEMLPDQRAWAMSVSARLVVGFVGLTSAHEYALDPRMRAPQAVLKFIQRSAAGAARGEFEGQGDENELWSYVHREHLVDTLDAVYPCGNAPNIVNHFAVGTLADQQSLGLVRQPDCGGGKDEPDEDRCYAVVRGHSGPLHGRDPRRRDEQTEQRRGILKQHHEARRILTIADRLDIGAPTLGFGELTDCEQPRGAFEQQRYPEDGIVHEEVLCRLWMLQSPHAAHQRGARTD